MPLVWIPDAELKALQAVLSRDQPRVDWDAYDRAKQHLLKPQRLSVDAVVAALAEDAPEPV